ncbi:hypothetical protein F2Q69_00009215 [Brassica cretica]|uniref:Uncharacterized protein n=1 Tax=Brassica cretica TaxID=69181 RepID=A0A8S9NZV4_BRACR|nr:hypothetical protein F2Q69_00009215 [Brassica cretica]
MMKIEAYRRDESALLVRVLGANCHASGFDASRRRTAHPCHEVSTGPSGPGHTLPGEAGPLPDRTQGMTREAGNPGDAPRIIDPGQDDATMAETDDSSTKDKPGWINGEDTDLKPADETEDELEPAEESMLELKPAEVIVDELDELSELSDTSLELNELSDTEDGAGLVAGRNEPFSAQRKIHNKFNLGRTLLCFLVRLSPSKQPLIRWTCASYQATFRNPSFGGLVSHIKHQLKSGSIIGPSATHCVTIQSISSPFWRVHIP